MKQILLFIIGLFIGHFILVPAIKYHNMSDIVWVVGRINEEEQKINGASWSLCGVYNREQDAIKACRDYHYFYGPEELNVDVGDIDVWPGCKFVHEWTEEDYIRVYGVDRYLKQIKEHYPESYTEEYVKNIKAKYE